MCSGYAYIHICITTAYMYTVYVDEYEMEVGFGEMGTENGKLSQSFYQ